MHKGSRMASMAVALAASFGVLGEAGKSAGKAALDFMAASANNGVPGFTRMFGNNPRSLNGSYLRNSNAAKQKRAARKLRNVRARSSKRRHG